MFSKNKFRTENYKKAPQPSTQAEHIEDFKKRRAEKRKLKEERLIRQWEEDKRLKEEEVAKAREQEEEKKNEKLLGRHYTVSIALPGSILDNAQSRELRSYLAGQIARAAVVFNVDEIIVFDETDSLSMQDTTEHGHRKQGCIQLKLILEYLECPQYLRKSLFKRHEFLQYAGLLNPLDCPHHMRATDETPFREGVVLDKPLKQGHGSYADVGLMKKEVQLDKQVLPNTRVTVKMDKQKEGKKRKGKVVAMSAPREQLGLYWGYEVRLARHLGEVFSDCPYPGGYDLTIGTSERGDSIDSVKLPDFKHILVVFGGLQGLEASLETMRDSEVEDPRELFQLYLNSCPTQGSRTIRTEEAILITMSALRPRIADVQARMKAAE